MAASSTTNGHINGSASRKPTVLVVSGAWHVPQHYRLVSDGLRAQGFQVLDPCLPSNSNQTPLADLDDDITFLRHHAKSILDKGQDLLVLMHSYGGALGSYAFANLPTPATRQWRPDGGRLVSLMYMAAFIPLAGESLVQIFGGSLPPFLPLRRETGEVILSTEAAKKHFYQDCTEEQQQQAFALLVRHGIDAQFETPRRQEVLSDLGLASAEGLKGMTMAYSQERVEVCYIFCDVDAGLLLELQEMMVGRVKKLGVQVKEWHVMAGHSPFANKPEDIVKVVEEMGNSLK